MSTELSPGEPHGSPLPPGPAIDVVQLLRLLQHRWKLIAAAVGACLAVGLGNYFVSPKLYRAATTLQIEQRSLVPVGANRNPWLDQWASMKYLPTQYRLLESRGLAERVVRDLRLAEDPAFAGRRAARPDADGVTASDDAIYLAGLAGRLLGGLDVAPVEGTELVTLSYVAGDPELAARVVNGFADAFISWGVESHAHTVGRATEFLEKQIEDLKQQIQQKETQLQQYGANADLVSLDPGANVVLQRLTRVNQQHGEAQSETLAKEQRYRELQATPASVLAKSRPGSQVPALERELLELEAGYEGKLQTYKPEHPEMVELAGQIEEKRRLLAETTEREAQAVRQEAYAEWQAAQGLVNRLGEQQQQAKTDTVALNLDAVEYYNLQMEIDARKEMLSDLMTRLSEAGVSASLDGSEAATNVRIIDRALVPGGPFRPSLRQNLSLGLAVGLVLGVGLVFGIHFLDRTVKTADELQSLLGALPVLAVIPDVSLPRGAYGRGYGYGARRGGPTAAGETLEIELLPERHPRLAVSEAYRSLRTALLLSSAERLQVVAVTSAEAGEGKTTTAANLAVVMAQLGRRVLLVDADLRKPRVHRLFNLGNRLGLVSTLTGSAEADTAVAATDITGLSVCPSGPLPPNPSELLASERMARFVEWSRKRFDFVILDTPPVLAVSDAILPGSFADGVVLCFRANQVHREAVRGCRDQLLLAEVKILGAVFNCQRPSGGGRYGRASYRYYESNAHPAPQADSAA